jgi:hypothetical protein
MREGCVRFVAEAGPLIRNSFRRIIPSLCSIYSLDLVKFEEQKGWFFSTFAIKAEGCEHDLKKFVSAVNRLKD